MPSKLYFEAKAFVQAYEQAFGVPDKAFTEYWTLKKRLTKIGSTKKETAKVGVKTRRQQTDATLQQRIKLLQSVNASNALKVFVKDEGMYLTQDFEFNNRGLICYLQCITAFSKDGRVLRIIIRYNGSSITKGEVDTLTKMFKRSA